ncbi:MAG: DUF4143 domain-containing protein, partial [Clostridia bacterium]|nr:DUF4143 domain-containing protein [Clostridia bacterium]
TEKKRIIDNELDLDLKTVGAVLIEGPRGCGKSYTAGKRAKSVLDFRNAEKKATYVETAPNAPDQLLVGENPRLFVEWQKAPQLWDSIRCSVDQRGKQGLYMLTGQDSNFYNVMHSGIGRYSVLNMWPMSLYESGESSGEVSLSKLLNKPESFDSCESSLSTDEIINTICRGGWPECVCNPDISHQHIKDILNKTCEEDVPAICCGRKSADIAKKIITAYAKDICSASNGSRTDLMSRSDISYHTLQKYISALEQLYIIEDIPAWTRNIRDRSHRTLSGKRNIVDPSLAVCSMGIEKADLRVNFRLLSRLFECLCYRDLKVYTEARCGKIYYYKDRYNLEVDCILSFDHCRYALVDFEMGQNDLEKGMKKLNKLESLILRYNEAHGYTDTETDIPATKILITGTRYGYRCKDGVLVVPIGCLKD